MKTKSEIEAEIRFQEMEYDRTKTIIASEAGKDFSELKKQVYNGIMGRHAARRQALLWVIEV